MVINGTLDLECGITTHTAERARSQAFSLTIFVAETRLMTRGGERVRGLFDALERGESFVRLLELANVASGVRQASGATPTLTLGDVEAQVSGCLAGRDLVAELIGDAGPAQAWLNQHGTALHRYAPR